MIQSLKIARHVPRSNGKDWPNAALCSTLSTPSQGQSTRRSGSKRPLALKLFVLSNLGIATQESHPAPPIASALADNSAGELHAKQREVVSAEDRLILGVRMILAQLTDTLLRMYFFLGSKGR